MNQHFLDISRHFMSIRLRAVRLIAASMLCAVSFAAYAQSASSTEVGTVSLVLGKVYIESPNQARELIEKGSVIRVSDSILTGPNGHVHIHFIDDGLVSVRPGSRLDVVRYDYNKANPEQSFVKFNLQEGVTRSISGDAAKSARQRFRLNTPIAAIGVRGTDFVVSATDQSTRALVNEGIIVMAPYSNECSADSFGPCALNALELTDNSLQIIELDGTEPAPRLLAATHEREPGTLSDEVQLAIASNDSAESDPAEGKSATNDVYLESVTPTRVTQEAASAAPSLVAKEPDFTPAAAVSNDELSARNLLWGRWSDDQLDAERITLAYLDAREGRAVTVGNDDYILFRNEDNGSRVDRGLGVVSFDLNSAQAFYSSTSGVVAMQVDDGSLDINFDSSEFATELNLSHSLTGDVGFAASGRISDGGYFNSREASQNIAGAVSTDGTEAGYFFERQLLDGGIQGITLWDAQ